MVGSFTLREVFEAMEIDAVSDLDIKREKEPARKNSGTRWIKQLTTIVWNHIYQVWLERNVARHGKEEEEKSVLGLLTRFRHWAEHYLYI